MDLLGVGSLPYLSRRNYYYEFIHLLPWGVLAGMVEGNVASIVVANTFHGSDLLVATASATPIGTLLFSLVWGMMCVGRPKLRAATVFGAATAGCAATVCLTPRTPRGAVLFVIQIAAAQVFLSGVVTVRAALWKHNYPPGARGRIAARLQALRMLTTVVILIGASMLLDHDAGTYRYLYPASAAAGLAGLAILQRVHVRHERAELNSSRTATASDDVARTVRTMQPISMVKALWPAHVVGEMVRLLRRDRRYRRYLFAHAQLGIGMQIVMPVLVVILHGAFERYWISVVLIEVIPKLTMFGSLRRWGRWFDRIPVTRFRMHTGVCAAGGVLFGLIATWVITAGRSVSSSAALPVAAVLFGARAVMHGLQRGGGSLAWNLGHLHFSGHDDAEIYMGVHVSLTGLRGLVAPYVGIVLWRWLGWGVWAVALALCLGSAGAFRRLAAEESPDHRSI